jgi:hypothetical protein
MKPKHKVLLALAIVVPLAGVVAHRTLLTEPVSCNQLLMEKASEVERKMLMQNSDGGLYLMTEGVEERQILFIGYVGPVSAEQLRVQMINAGLSKVHVETDGICVSEGGLEYTVVTGSYITAAQPDPT